ncbi:CheR family methyltransferase [Bacillus sp. B-jedd]|uniref:CheR family methyltransferase n=1 Tax=Bacillus sp. B-jedd TaxID=1476857 RepID=UPI0005156323|nr:protein-glutamate O-methyltransferase CheR [Bacillus sp. B-jedd]CEG25875.1 MCP methyltransferase, CheR-type [Bacillus sp. B-jedd]
MISMSNKEFLQMSDYIHQNYGIYLKEEKKMILEGRLCQLLQELNFSSYSDYFQHLLEDKTEMAVSALVERVTTNHTYFMREKEHFFFFQNTILPNLAQAERSRDLRIWSAGCSTGEEPYTLAMILDEFFGVEKQRWDTKVLATDLSTKVLISAKKGVYRKESLAVIPAIWKQLYFNEKTQESSEIVDRIKNEVIFRRLNLMEPTFPFKKKFHVIFCRNVMIYFDQETKKELVDKFYSCLETGGYLFIGQSETIDRSASKFRYIMPAVYRKE